jgi:hypothetical protein
MVAKNPEHVNIFVHLNELLENGCRIFPAPRRSSAACTSGGLPKVCVWPAQSLLLEVDLNGSLRFHRFPPALMTAAAGA